MAFLDELMTGLSRTFRPENLTSPYALGALGYLTGGPLLGAIGSGAGALLSAGTSSDQQFLPPIIRDSPQPGFVPGGAQTTVRQSQPVSTLVLGGGYGVPPGYPSFLSNVSDSYSSLLGRYSSPLIFSPTSTRPDPTVLGGVTEFLGNANDVLSGASSFAGNIGNLLNTFGIVRSPYQKLMDSFQQKIDEANRANERRYRDTLSGYENLQDFNQKAVNNLFRGKEKLIREQAQALKSRTYSDLVGRGLGNTTLTTGADELLLESLGQGLASLGGTQAGAQAQLVSPVALGRLQAMERKQEVAPNYEALFQIMSGVGRAGAI